MIENHAVVRPTTPPDMGCQRVHECHSIDFRGQEHNPFSLLRKKILADKMKNYLRYSLNIALVGSSLRVLQHIRS